MNIDTPDEEIEIHNERIVSTEVAVKVAEEFFRYCILKVKYNNDYISVVSVIAIQVNKAWINKRKRLLKRDCRF